MATSGQGDWCVYVRLDRAPDIKVFFETEDDAAQANRTLVESLEEARAARKTIASFNDGKQSIDSNRYVSSEVLPANRVPGGR